MDRIIFQDKIYTFYEYSKEEDFETNVVKHSQDIFGPKSIYLDVKKRIGEDNILTIPDGYLIDFSFETDPRLYIIENELVIHDPYKHIGQQLLKFAISYKASGRQIKSFLLANIMKDRKKKSFVEQSLGKVGFGYEN